jgi:hypothetical protein
VEAERVIKLLHHLDPELYMEVLVVEVLVVLENHTQLPYQVVIQQVH